MRLWRAIVLMVLALTVGIGLGYVRWGREARHLREAAAVLPEQKQRSAEPGRWTARGIVRIVLRDQGVVFLTHEAIPGVMVGSDARAPGYETAAARLSFTRRSRPLHPGTPGYGEPSGRYRKVD